MSYWKIAELEPPNEEGEYLTCDDWTIRMAYYFTEDNTWFQDSEADTQYHDVKFWQKAPDCPNISIPKKEENHE